MRLLIVLFTAVIGIYITTLGFEQLVVYFHGSSIGFGKTYLLGLAFGFLRHHPFNVTMKINQTDTAELIGICIASLIFDSLATFLILPYVLG